MPFDDSISTRKRELLAYKAKILQEIKYCDKRIEEVRSKCLKSSFVDDSNSSESEEEFSLSIDNGPSVSQLKQQQAMLRTCLQATQELTSLQMLQSEVNVLVEDPVIMGEPPVKEPGVWQEVTAECRVDLVPFSMTFFVHKPERQFGQLSYRGLRVVPVKSAHEGELNRSVLPSVGRPSDAVEVMKSYAAAQRSRRTSLARLADRYAERLRMEPMPDGGYTLRCANLLEVSWTLQNKWSPIAPFHHRMKFDIEYMDESYIKTITQAHRQLSDPSLETDERTLLLSKIISTCIEAQGPTQEMYESMSSDPENAQTLKTRRTTLDQEPEAPGTKKKKEKELMAPPKSLPKKTKLKGKENVADNKEKLKRANSDENMNNVKKIRTEIAAGRIVSESVTKSSEITKKVATVANNANSNKQIDISNPKQVDRASVTSAANNIVKKVHNKNENKNKVEKDKNEVNVNHPPVKKKIVTEKMDKVKEATLLKNLQNAINSDKNVDKPKEIKGKAKKPMESIKNDGKTKMNEKKHIGGYDNQKTVVSAKKILKAAETANLNKNKETFDADKNKRVKKVSTAKNKPDTAKSTDSNYKNVKGKASTEKGDKVNVATVINDQPTNNELKDTNNVESKVENQKHVNSAKNKEPTKIKPPNTKISSNGENDKKVSATKQTDNKNQREVVNNENKLQTNKNIKSKIPANKTTQNKKHKPIENTNKISNMDTDKTENTVEKVIEKSVAIKRKSNMVDKTDNVTSAKKLNTFENKANSTEKPKKTGTNNKIQKITKTLTPKLYQKFKSKLIPGTVKTHTGNTKVLGDIEKQNSDKKSKIPQKKLTAISETTLKNNPLRISPRKLPSKFKSHTDVNKMIQKTTSIPRLLKKPVPKT